MTVSRETQLEQYRALLLRWSESLNLSSARDSDEAGFQSHITDSLSLLPYLPVNLTRLIDLGSGQGFPAIPLGIYTGITIDLVEADRRKAAFLTTTLATLGLAGKVWPIRIESAAIPPACCVTARALAPLSRLIPLARPLLLPGGYCLFLKGPGAAAEITDAEAEQTFTAEIFSTSLPRSNLVRITNVR